jgi:hypothetical protein
MTNPFTPAVHRYQVGGEDQPAQQAQEVTAGPQKMTASGSSVGGITSVVVNSAGTSVSTNDSVYKHAPGGNDAPASGLKYSTPFGSAIAAADARPHDLVTIGNQTMTVQVAKSIGLLS